MSPPLPVWALSVPRDVMGVRVANPYGLGALTPTEAAQQIFPNAPRSSSAGHNMATFNVIQASAAAGQIVDANGAPAYMPGSGDCAGVSLTAPVLLTTGGSMALRFAALTGPAAPLVALAGGIMDLFGAISAHHAAAVKKERSVLCAAVPAANQTLQLIQQAVQSGAATPQQAIAALAAMPGQFSSQVSSIIHGADPTVSGECNAACVMLSCLRAVVVELQSQYQDMIAAAATSSTGSAFAPVSNVVARFAASTGLPSWVFWVFGGWLLYEVL